MINVAAHIAPDASDLAGLACGHLDDLVTYVTHLSGSADDAVEFVAGGLAPAIWLSRKLPVLRWIAAGATIGVVAGWMTAVLLLPAPVP